jgi:hypothetical protein
MLPIVSGVAVLAASQDYTRRIWARDQWAERYPIVWENSLPLARIGSEKAVAVKDCIQLFSRSAPNPSGVICSLVGASKDTQQSFLYGLESLQPQWKVLLLVDSIDLVLPTVRSRTINWSLGQWTKDELAGWGEEHGYETKWILQAEGSKAQLAHLHRAGRVLEKRENTLAGWLEIAQTFSEEEFRGCLHLWPPASRSWAEDMLNMGARATWVVAGGVQA